MVLRNRSRQIGVASIRSWCILPQSSAAFSRLFATMSSAPATSHEEVLEFWFGGSLQDNLKNKWFSAEVTPLIKERFTDMTAKAIAGGYSEWEEDQRSHQALIIVLDQFTRTIYKGTAQMFAGDPRAFELAKKFIERYDHRSLTLAERIFLHIPFEHCESHDAQEKCLELCRELEEDYKGTPDERAVGMTVNFAKDHKEVIDMFGRYPQRNTALGRQNTPEEEEFLKNMPDKYRW